MRRSVLAVAGLAIFAAACGGSSSSPAAAPAPTPIPSAVVVLDSGNFDALVLGAAKPALVEFQLPT